MLIAVVPLATLAATGRLRDTWHALRAYGLHIGAFAVLIALGALTGVIAAMFSS